LNGWRVLFIKIAMTTGALVCAIRLRPTNKEMPRHRRPRYSFQAWCTKYFAGKRYRARNAWWTARALFAGERWPNYPQRLREALSEATEWRWKYEAALKEITELKVQLQDRRGLINEFYLDDEIPQIQEQTNDERGI
jgi:hypothetical protein